MKLTPLQSIRKFCLGCCNENSTEVRLCPATNCPLHKRRLGKGGGRILKIIRANCLDCSGWNKQEVRNCKFNGNIEDLCSLYPYRLGKRPTPKAGLSVQVLEQRKASGRRLQGLRRKRKESNGKQNI